MKRLWNMTGEEIAEVDAKLRHQPIEPVLKLWEDLRAVGDMPGMKPEHVRAMAWALYNAQQRDNPKSN